MVRLPKHPKAPYGSQGQRFGVTAFTLDFALRTDEVGRDTNTMVHLIWFGTQNSPIL